MMNAMCLNKANVCLRTTLQKPVGLPVTDFTKKFRGSMTAPVIKNFFNFYTQVFKKSLFGFLDSGKAQALADDWPTYLFGPNNFFHTQRFEYGVAGNETTRRDK
jgi:hypothetical protein